MSKRGQVLNSNRDKVNIKIHRDHMSIFVWFGLILYLKFHKNVPMAKFYMSVTATGSQNT